MQMTSFYITLDEKNVIMSLDTVTLNRRKTYVNIHFQKVFSNISILCSTTNYIFNAKTTQKVCKLKNTKVYLIILNAQKV